MEPRSTSHRKSIKLKWTVPTAQEFAGDGAGAFVKQVVNRLTHHIWPQNRVLLPR